MPELNTNQLFHIIVASTDLDRVEEWLRNNGERNLADALLKLQQDAGLKYGCPEEILSGREPAPGGHTALLVAAYEVPTTERAYDLFTQIFHALPDASSKRIIGSLHAKLKQDESAQPSPTASPPLATEPG